MKVKEILVEIIYLQLCSSLKLYGVYKRGLLGLNPVYNTKRDWVITTPDGEEIVFKKDAVKCKGFTSIDMGCC